ncbi:MAG: hypothetical protein SGPRY_007519 [Prymnesium sp.]
MLCCFGKRLAQDDVEEEEGEGKEQGRGHRSAPALRIPEQGAADPSSEQLMYVRTTNGSQHPNKFQKVRSEGPWWVSRCASNGKLFWMHEVTRELTWRQPVPTLSSLPQEVRVHEGMREWTRVVVDKRFFGAPADESNPQARVGICGRAPDGEHLRVTAELLSTEHTLYPPAFLKTIGLQFYLLCEDLSYNNQRRRDVPDLATGILYIDVGDRSVRRKRHSFHHELWHMIDFHLLGNAFEGPDFEWAAFNPQGFQYGRGGKHMRTDAMSSQDKAEVWACLMNYQHIIKSDALRGKAELLKKRVLQLCSDMDTAWWAHVRKMQLKQTDHWEPQSILQDGQPMWINWLTGEQRRSKPKIEPLTSDEFSAEVAELAKDCDEKESCD